MRTPPTPQRTASDTASRTDAAAAKEEMVVSTFMILYLAAIQKPSLAEELTRPAHLAELRRSLFQKDWNIDVTVLRSDTSGAAEENDCQCLNLTKTLSMTASFSRLED